MGKLDEDYYWKATFDGGIPNISQFDEDGNEILFKEVEDNILVLEKFELISPDEKEVYLVDLVKKKISGPNISYNITGTSPKLIYFKRQSVRSEFRTGKIVKPLTVFHLGIKTSTQEKKLEIFKGMEQNPKKVEFSDVKSKIKVNITKSIKEKNK